MQKHHEYTTLPTRRDSRVRPALDDLYSRQTRRRRHTRPGLERLEERSLLSSIGIWNSSATPANPTEPDTSAAEVGVKFYSDVSGSITGLKFYKGSTNTGTHVADLWTSSGTLLATATFSNETASGWQQVNFSSPVAIKADTTYVASYHANASHYADDQNYFSSQYNSGQLHVPANGGVYAYGGAGTFPNQVWNASNYWVDVVFSTSSTDTTPPTVTAQNPGNNATGVPLSKTCITTFSESVQPSTINFILKDSKGDVVPSTVTYTDSTHTATLTPTSLLATSSTYTATVSGVKDLAGNVMTAPVTETFVTAATDTASPTVSSKFPSSGATNVGVSTAISATFSEAVQSSTISLLLQNSAGTPVAGSVAYNSSTYVVTLTPSAALVYSTPYTATLSGAKDLAGNTMTPVSWSFTTNTAPPPPTNGVLANVGLTAGWATVGETLPQGAAPHGLQLVGLQTQVDVKNLWPDGSIKYAIVSARVSTAGTYQLTDAAPSTGSFTPTLPNASVKLNIGGVIYTAALPAQPTSDVWLSGPLVDEFRSVVTPVDSSGHPQPYLQAVFDTRSYQGGGNRLDVTVQNVQNIAGATSVTYSVDIVANGQTLYHHDTLTQYYMTRWRQVLDVGMTESAVTPDLSTVVQAGALPQYDTSVISNTNDSAPSGASYDILGIGPMPSDMGTGGEDGVRTCLYPTWVPEYLTYKNPNDVAMILKNGDLAGSWPMHLNMSDGNPVNIDQNPMFWMDPRGGQWGTQGIAGDWNGRGPLNPDQAHTPSLAYVPYLITGDRYYADEMKDWAAWGLASGNPGYRGGNGSQGLLIPGLGQVRALAWQLRQSADAAAYLPDNDPFRAYFANKLQNNLNWMDDQAVNHVGPLGSIFEQGDNPSGHNIPVWQYGYVTWAVEHANDLTIPGVSGGRTAERQMAQFAMSIYNDPRMATNPYGLGWVFVTDSSGVYYTTEAQLIQANGLPSTNDPNYYGPHNDALLRIAIRNNLPGAQTIWNRVYPNSLAVLKTRPEFAMKIRGVTV